jgi:hypothetical protein
MQIGALERTSTKEEFVKKSIEVHTEIYDYSKVVYINGDIPVIIGCSNHGLFEQKPRVHLRGSGCNKCAKKSYSAESIEWLTYMSDKLNIDIQHAENKGEYVYFCDNKSYYKFDGYCKEKNIVFEYHGCMWHGCNKCFNKDDNHPFKDMTHEESYEKTIERENNIKSLGFELVTIWSHDWKNMKKLKA